MEMQTRPDRAQTVVQRPQIAQPSKALDQWKVKTDCDLASKEQELKRLSLQRSHVQEEVYLTQSERDKIKTQLEHVQEETKSVEEDLEEKKERRQMLEEAVKSVGRSMPLLEGAFKPVDIMKETVECSLGELRKDLEAREKKTERKSEEMGHLIQLKIQELETKKEEKNDVEQTLVKMTGTLASYIQAAEAQVEMKAKLLDQKVALEDTLKQVSDAVQDMQSRVDEIKSNIKTSRSQINERKEHCETQMHEKGEKMNALQIQWDNAEAEKNALETTLEEKKKILAEGHDELKKLHHTYEKLRATSTEASKTIDEELRKVSEKQERLGQDIEAAKGQNQVAQEKVSSLTQENTGLELKLQTRSDEIRALQQEIDRLTNYYNELPGARKDLELAQFDIQSLRSVQARSFGLEKENKILKEKKRQLETDLQAMEAQFNANNDDEHEFNHTLLEMKTIEEEWNRKSRELKEKQAQRTLALDLKKVLETKNEELNNLREEQTRKYNQQVNQIKTSTDQTIVKKDKLEKVLEKLSNDLNRVQNQDDVAKTKDPLGTADEDTPRPTHPRLKKTLTSDSNSSASSDWLSSFQKSRESKALPTKGSLSTLFDSASDSQ